jgi:hypothetical protein
MTTSDWINLAAAISGWIGILCLGIIAWLTIRQTRSIQKAEKRERLLNEVIEWAEDICRSSFGTEIEQETLVLENRLLNYQELYIISKYIEKIAEKFGVDLYLTVSSITTPLANVIGAIQEYLKNPQDEHIDARLEGYEEQLLKRARTLIEKVAEIKTKDIS